MMKNKKLNSSKNYTIIIEQIAFIFNGKKFDNLEGIEGGRFKDLKQKNLDVNLKDSTNQS